MAKRITRTVHVFDEDGRSQEFLPGAVLPKWAEDKVTNPRVYEDVAGASASDSGDADGSPSHPEGEPSTSWTHDQLNAYAEAHELEWSQSSLTKEEKVGEINGDTASR